MKKLLLLLFAVPVCAAAYGQTNATADQRPGAASSYLHTDFFSLINGATDGIEYCDAVVISHATLTKDPLVSFYTLKPLAERKKEIKAGKVIQNAWGYRIGSDIYVNISRIGGGEVSYSKVLTDGRYLLFFSKMPVQKQDQDKLQLSTDDRIKADRNTSIQAGAMGFGLMGVAIAVAATKTHYLPVVIDTTKGAIRAFSPEYALALKEMYPEVADVTENKKYTYRDLVDYFAKINILAAGGSLGEERLDGMCGN